MNEAQRLKVAIEPIYELIYGEIQLFLDQKSVLFNSYFWAILTVLLLVVSGR